MNVKYIRVGDRVRIGMLMGANREWLGIGPVVVAGVSLRDGRHPLVPRLATPDGHVYTKFELDWARSEGNTATVHLHAYAVHTARTEYLDEYTQRMVVPGADRQMAKDSLTLTLKSAAERLGGREWAGFEWQWMFSSRRRRIHAILVDGSWEIGGRITGCVLLHQGQCNRPVYRGSRGTDFTTACLKTLQQRGSPQGMSYQLAPRGGLIQAFDFMHTEDAAFLIYWPKYDSVCSLLESPQGHDRLYVLDEYRVRLARRAVSLPQRFLVAAGPLADHEARDLWWAAHERVYGGYRRAFRVKPTMVRPEIGLKYSVRVVDGGLKVSIGGVEVDSREVPYAIGDHVIPLLHRAGIRRFFPEVMSESDVTVLGMERKLDRGIHGDLHCSSVCATHRFVPSEFWGGMKAWHYMAEKARALGIEIGAWFAPHFSPRARIFQEHPEWRMIDVNTMPSGGGYGWHTIISADWNTEIFDWVLADIKRWKEEGGLDYLFTDSFANLGLLQQNYARMMRTSWRRLAQLYGEFSKMGIKALTFEGISPFGASRFGIADLRGDLLGPAAGIVGQNDLGWWVDDFDMAYGLCLGAAFRKRPEAEIRSLCFRAAAARGYLMMDSLCGHLYDLPEWARELNIIYEKALPHMVQRTLLPDRSGICWRGDGASVIWALRATDVEVDDGAQVLELGAEDDTAIEPSASGKCSLQAGRVYMIRHPGV